MADANTPAPAAPTSDLEMAEAMYGSLDSIKKVYAPSLGDSMGRLQDVTGMDAEQADAHLTEVAVAFHDADLNHVEASGLHSLMVRYYAKPPDQETVDQWTVEARRELRTRFGDDAPRRLKAVQDFIAARPALRKQLNQTGVGSHPDFIVKLAEQAYHLRPPRKRR